MSAQAAPRDAGAPEGQAGHPSQASHSSQPSRLSRTGLVPARPAAGAASRRGAWSALVRAARQVTTGRWRRVAVFAVAATLVSVETPLVASIDHLRVGPALALCFSHGASLLLAMWRPRWAVAVSVAASVCLVVASLLGGGGPWPWGVTPLIVQTCVIVLTCLVGGWRTGLTCLVLSIALPAAIIPAAAGWRGLAGPISDLLVFASIAGTALALTAALQSRVFMAAALVREQRAGAEESSRRRLVEEKARIARELHDVIAHSMSLISVQARSAAYRLPDLPAPAAAEFDEIADRAKEALDQMRGVLAVLRAPDTEAPRTPQPRLRDVPALVESARAAGLGVDLAWDVPEHVDVAPATALSVHRIVQEALSNVMRHAPDRRASVQVRVADGALVTTVENPLAAPPAPAVSTRTLTTLPILPILPTRLADRTGLRPQSTTGSATSATVAGGTGGQGGHGLIGMRERAAAAGGVLDAGPTPEGGFRVQARLPLGSAGGLAPAPAGTP